MTYRPLSFTALLAAILIALPQMIHAADLAATPEMVRLAQQRVGDWDTREIVQHGKPVRNGAGRRGIVHVWLAAGGSILVADGHSSGTVGGDLRWHIVTWWDAEAKVYRLFTCFKVVRRIGMRGPRDRPLGRRYVRQRVSGGHRRQEG